jgi:hypothetical protein
MKNGAEACRKHGTCEPTLYAWKAKFGGMSIPDAKRLKQLKEENGKLRWPIVETFPSSVSSVAGGVIGILGTVVMTRSRRQATSEIE